MPTGMPVVFCRLSCQARVPAIRCLELHHPLSRQALCVRGEGYSFEESVRYLTHLDTELEKRNEGATAVLKQFGLHPTDAA